MIRIVDRIQNCKYGCSCSINETVHNTKKINNGNIFPEDLFIWQITFQSVRHQTGGYADLCNLPSKKGPVWNHLVENI